MPLAGLLLLAGCTKEQDPPRPAAMPEPQAGQAALADGISPAAARDLQDPARAFAAELEQLTATAIRAEERMQFAGAIAAWQSVEQTLLRAFGPDSWQVRNARLARTTAEQKSKLSPHQLDRLSQLTETQQKIGQAIAAGDHAAALELALRASPETAMLFGEQSWMQARQLVQLARLRHMAGQTEEAIATYQQAAGLVLELAGPVHPELESLHAWLATCFGKAGKPDLELANLRKAAGLAQQIWGETSEQYALRANELGVALHSRGESGAAVRVLSAAETIRVRALGDEHPLVAHSRLNLSSALMGIREYAEALRLLDLAEPVLQRGGAATGSYYVQALRQRAALLMLLDRPAAAEPVIRNLLSLIQSGSGPDNQAIAAELHYRLAVCLARQGRFADAVAPAQESLASRSRQLGGNHPETGKTRDLLVSLFERTGQTARADELRGSVRSTSFESAPGGR